MYLEIMPKKKIKKSTSLLINILACVFLSLLTNYILQYFHDLGNFTSALRWVIDHPAAFFVGSLFIFFIYVFALSLFANIYLSSFICLIIFCTIGFSNTNKMNILGEPLYPVDFYQIRYINSLFKMIGGKLSLFAIVLTLIAFLIVIYILKRLPKLPLGVLTRVLLFFISSFMIYSYITFDSSIMNKPIKKSGIDVVLWNQPYNYATNGFVFGLLSNFQTDVMNEPAGYSEETIKQISSKFTKEAVLTNLITNNSVSVKTPNIIFLMNETFWDPTRLSTFTFSEDPLKNIREIMAENSSGWLLSPEFGGNTANVEFEALTGFSMYNLLPGSIPYQQSMDKTGTFPSFVNMLKENGYSSLALHPFNKTFYKRNRVYNNLGFDEFIGEDDMHFKEYFSKESYVSDQSVVNEIFHKLENKSGPIFIHAVTMQNHTPIFDGKYGENTVSVEGLTDEALTKELETYTEGIKKTDIAIKNLIDNISKFDEPTIVVFWGDHLPALSNEIYTKAGYSRDSSYENQRVLSETPLFIYSNFSTKKTDLKSISPAFLGVTIYDFLGLPVNPYYALLKDIKSIVPGLNASVLIDSNGDIKNELSDEEMQLLQDYKLIQYDLLVGKKYSLPLLFR